MKEIVFESPRGRYLRIAVVKKILRVSRVILASSRDVSDKKFALFKLITKVWGQLSYLSLFVPDFNLFFSYLIFACRFINCSLHTLLFNLFIDLFLHHDLQRFFLCTLTSLLCDEVLLLLYLLCTAEDR